MRTVLVLGIGASGTSAVAGALHKMGCPMGLDGHLDAGEHYEDVCFYGAFDASLSYLKRLIEIHTQAPIWGWKNTLTIKAIPELYPLLEGPRVVAVHRMLTASVRGRRDGRCPPGVHYSQGQAERWAVEAMNEYTRALGATYKAGVPLLHVGFEDLLEVPERVIVKVADFAFEERPSEELIQKAIDHIEPGRIHGPR